MAGEQTPLWVGHGASASLRALKCGSCGAALFPPQTYGCTVCGAFGEQLRAVEFPARGRLVSFATVHRHHSHPVPFTVGDIELEAGPVVRAQLADGVAWKVGQQVEGKVTGEGADEHLEFEPQGATR